MNIYFKKIFTIPFILATAFMLNACENKIKCTENDTFCKYQRGDYKDFKECSGTNRACYKTDNYHDTSCPWVRSLGTCYDRTTKRYFYYDKQGKWFGETNIDYGENEGNLSHAIFLVGTTKVYRGFYRNNKPMYNSIGGNDMPYVGYYEDDGSIGRIQFKELNIDVIYKKDGSCKAHEGLRSFGDQGNYSCEELKSMAQNELAKYGIKN